MLVLRGHKTHEPLYKDVDLMTHATSVYPDQPVIILISVYALSRSESTPVEYIYGRLLFSEKIPLCNILATKTQIRFCIRIPMIKVFITRLMSQWLL